MGIRVIVQTCDAGMAANVGGSVMTTYRTFDVEAPELEAFLRGDLPSRDYSFRQVSGWELIANGGQ
jgi:hypothetical protein